MDIEMKFLVFAMAVSVLAFIGLALMTAGLLLYLVHEAGGRRSGLDGYITLTMAFIVFLCVWVGLILLGLREGVMFDIVCLATTAYFLQRLRRQRKQRPSI